MAHAYIYLMLLSSDPDMVRSKTLHKTLNSTFHITIEIVPFSTEKGLLAPRIVDFGNRAPLAPRLVRFNYYKAY